MTAKKKTATKNDLTQLIEASLDGIEYEAAVARFPMFKAQQVKGIYEMSVPDRRQLLSTRTTDDRTIRQRRNPEQVLKMIDIAIDPSNH